MFTGLIQCIGQIVRQEEKNGEASIWIDADFKDYTIGESIAVNGACLSVTQFKQNHFCVFASFETLSITGLNTLSSGTKVNLEKALTLQTPLGGHLVTGHVDTRVKLLEKIPLGQASKFIFQLPEDSDLSTQIAPKGSVTIDGVSLTINTVSQSSFELIIIPITLRDTTLGTLKAGDFVNLETDLLAKYIARRLNLNSNPQKKDIDLNLLYENGFMR